MYALVTETGSIFYTMVKPPAGGIPDNYRLVNYSPPAYNPKLYKIIPIEPVVGDSVEFTIEPKIEETIKHYTNLIDSSVDSIYSRAIGNRGPEYSQAETEAHTYLANPTAEVPPYVLSWSTASGVTPEAAATDILAQATKWRAAALSIRANRLKTKQEIKAGNISYFYEWEKFVELIEKELGI